MRDCIRTGPGRIQDKKQYNGVAGAGENVCGTAAAAVAGRILPGVLQAPSQTGGNNDHGTGN